MSTRILVIDDDIHICEVLVSFFEEKGYSGSFTLTLEEAREELKKQPLPDIVFLDVMMRDGNGLIFLREIKRNPVTQNVPVIMISALRNRGQDRVAGLEFGADDYLGKPFDLQEVKIRMDRILQQKNKAANISGDEPRLAADPILTESNPRERNSFFARMSTVAAQGKEKVADLLSEIKRRLKI